MKPINLRHCLLCIPLFAFCFTSSCTSDGECRKDKDVLLQAGFYTTEYDSVRAVYVTKNYSDTIKIFGLDNDSVLSDSISIKSISLSLKSFENTTKFVFQVLNKTPDTITFIHKNEEYFLSLECGELIFYTLENVEFTTNQIDSVLITNQDITLNKTENIKIYFRQSQ
jgi:hypothetical protein